MSSVWNPGWFGQRLNENINSLQQGSFRALAPIFCVLTERHAPSKKQAAAALTAELTAMGFDDVVRIHGQLQQTTSMEWFIDWRSVSLEDLFTSSMTEAERRAVTVFASFHPNGYLREQAVRQMPQFAGTLPYLLLRQNDWVPQVQRAAEEAFDQRLNRLSEGELVAALPYAEKLNRSGRSFRSDTSRRLFTLLCAPAHHADLQAGLSTSNVHTRRICIRAMLAVPEPDIASLSHHIRRERDPLLRAMLFQRLSELDCVTDEILAYMLRDKHPHNRSFALSQLYKNGDRSCEIEAFLLDKNASVRGQARWFVRQQQPDFDFLAFYRRHMDAYPAVCISGIGEVGHSSDADGLMPFLSSPNAPLVCAAAVSLMRLNADIYAAAVTELLLCQIPRVAKTAQRLLLKHGAADFSRLWEIFSQAPSEWTQLKCLALLKTAPKWPQLIYLLQALSCDGEALRTQVLLSLRGWLWQEARTFRTPDVQQQTQIWQLLARHVDKIPPELLAQLQFAAK